MTTAERVRCEESLTEVLKVVERGVLAAKAFSSRLGLGTSVYDEALVLMGIKSWTKGAPMTAAEGASDQHSATELRRAVGLLHEAMRSKGVMSDPYAHGEILKAMRILEGLPL